AFAEQAVAAGVRRLVLLSGRGEEGARLAEQRIQDAGAAWTILRAAFFAQNFDESFLVEPVLAGEVAFPAGDVAEPFVDADDIADVAVAALTGPGHEARIHELTGPRLLTFADAVSTIAGAIGRPIRYLPVSSGDYRDLLVGHGVPPAYATQLTDLFTEVLDGRNTSVAPGVRDVLGREPRDFADYARAAAATGVWDGDAR
ncbi:MAG: NmrA family transcriptional regulator, partial [Pseudonocardia sp.]|nr:NmrA family transcriptional regulator [Pseudonocardia sp.]